MPETASSAVDAEIQGRRPGEGDHTAVDQGLIVMIEIGGRPASTGGMIPETAAEVRAAVTAEVRAAVTAEVGAVRLTREGGTAVLLKDEVSTVRFEQKCMNWV